MKSSKIIQATTTITIAYSLHTVWHKQQEHFIQYLFYLALSFAAFFITDKLIPIFKKYNAKADLVGKDLNKKGTPAGEVPVYFFPYNLND